MTMIGACGLLCHGCPAYLALKKKDSELQKETAAAWSRLYQTDIKPEDIHCTGCTSSTDALFAHCYECYYRNCSHEKKISTCAQCRDYPCEKLQSFFEMVPEAKKTLDDLSK